MMKSLAQPFVKCIAAGLSLLRKRGGIFLAVCLLHLALAGTAQAQARTILYVNKELAASGDGQAWGTAFKTLQEALDVTNANDATNYEIWVAEGAYYPDEGNGRSNNDRTQYFRINRDNVQIYGGFAGDETLRDRRNWAAHPVILSGDINGDGTLSGNSYHVFYLNGRADNGGAPITNATLLDGVTITGGNAEVYYGNETDGGGIFCDAYGTNNRCSPALANVIISGNYAESGGGMFNNGFTSGVSSPSLTNIIISGNRADRGGGMYNNGFSGGTSSPSLTNVTISGNHATQNGGGMYNNGEGYGSTSSPALVNSVVWGNTAPSGAQMYNYGNTTPQVTYSNVEGGFDGTGNINLDPLFADPVAASSAPTSGGDYRLAHGSPSIDTGGTNTGCPAVDVEGRTRPVDGDGSGGPVCDMGAYEYRLRFVDRDAGGQVHDGLSWTTAYTNVQAALDMTNGNYLTDYDVWVAQGTYYPDEGGNHVADIRTESFRIGSDNVQLYGGFAGDETARGQRNWAANPAVLSGDIDGDGALANNAYHVVHLDGRAILGGITARAVLDGFIITGGNADGASISTDSGGGIYCEGLGAGSICSPRLANLVVRGNAAAFSGGGIMNNGAVGGVSRPALTNVLVSGNSAPFGGGVFNEGSNGGASSPKLMGVTVAGNSAGDGGGIYNNAQAGGANNPVIRNSILWGNAATNGPQIYDSGSGATPQVAYSLVQGGGYTGDGNITADPLFVAAVAASSAPTATGNYRLLRTSPAIDAGTNTGCPPDDLDSGVRPRDGNGDGTAICDMGAYESGLIFVDTAAPGPLHNGLSWTTAYNNVQDALEETNGSGLARYEVWVAEGTYYPDEGGSHVNDSRSESFRINWDNVQLYGGFAATETLRTQRDWAAHPTVLSGDIDGDGGLANNARHVVYLDGVSNEDITANTVLDGFTITGGNADTYPNNIGGGFYCNGTGAGHLCSPQVANSVIRGNSADYGGGMFNDGFYGESSPLLTNVTLSGNAASNFGGGMSNDGFFGKSRPLLTNVTLSGNRAVLNGGGMYNEGDNGESSPVLVNSILWGNTAADGAQIYNNNATPSVTNSNVQGGYAGAGNLDANPLFAAPVAASSAPTTTGDYRLLPGSPSIDSGTDTGAPDTDIRGLPRPVGLATDMGAYETQGFTLSVTGGDNQAAAVGATFGQSLTVQISSASSEPVGPGGVITLTPPSSGAGLSVTVPFTAASDAGGMMTTSVTANGVVGSYSVTATVRGAATPAVFSLTNTPISVTVALTGTGGGSVTSEPAGIDCGVTCTAAFDYSTPVTLTASADTGSTFGGWSGACSGILTCTVTMTETKAVTAAFTLNQYTIAVSAEPAAAGTVSGSGVYTHGDAVTATATANTGYTFTNWTEGGTPVSSSATYTFTATGSRTLVANFSLNQYTVAVSANPPAGGTVIGGGTVNHGDAVTVTATASAGYTFVNWTENGTEVSTSATYSFTAQGSRTLVANFRPNSPLHVDTDAPGPVHDGLSWTTAFTNVQDALYWANRYGTTDYEVWVAEGVYYPDEGGGHVDNSRSESIRIEWDNVQIFGGFAATETLRTQRDWTAHPTVLSGDIDGDGTATSSAYHVLFLDGVTNEGITDATVLDGFTVTGGNGDGDDAPPNDRGGGLYCDGSNGHLCSPALTNLIFSGNGAYLGGAIYNNGSYGVSSPVLWNVTFSDNLASLGGGVFNNGYYGVSSPSLTLVTVSDNAASYGGGMYNDGAEGVSSPVLTNVTVSGNYAGDSGGGMYNDGVYGVSSPVLTNVTVSGNQAGYGGGMYNKGAGGVSSPVLVNVIISGNRAGFDGGGMVNDGFFRGASNPVLTNVTLSGNRAESGGGMYNFGRYFGTVNPVLTNSIVWGNDAITGTQFYDYEAAPQVTYSNVQGDSVYTGTGNLNTDPLFAAPVAASSAPSTTSDYRLLPGSPAIDSGTGTGAPPTDIRGLPRPVGLATDMGAYEAQGFRLSISGGNNQFAAVGAAFSQSLAVQIGSLGGEPVGPGGRITFMPPAGGPGLSVTTPFTLATDAEGAAGTGATANGFAGSYNVTVAAGGVITPVAFVLTNTPVFVMTAIAGTGTGAVTSDPAGIQCPSACTAAFDFGTVVTLTASAETGSAFGGWSGACSGTGACTVTMTETKAVTAGFTFNQYAIAVSAEPAAGGTVSGGGTVSHGDAVTVTAIASTGYTFTNWTDGGQPVSSSATYTFTAEGDRTLVANFTLLQQPLASNDAAGVLEGQAITIPVLANDLDPAGRGLAVIAVTQPAHGTASIDGSGTSVRYATTGGFHSEDSFDYTLEDSNGLTSTAKVVVVMAPLAHAEQAPQLAVIDPSVPNSTTFTSNVVSVQVQLPAGFYSGTVGAAGIFFLSYTAVVTPTQQTLAPPPTLEFGNFQFFLSAYANELPLHGVPFAAPITLTIRYDPALLVGLKPETLQMLSWDGAGWRQDGITFVSHDNANATLTIRLSHLSEFALFAAPEPTGLDPTPEPDGALKHLYLPFVNNRALEPLEPPLEPPLAPAAPTAEPVLPAGVSHIYLPAASR